MKPRVLLALLLSATLLLSACQTKMAAPFYKSKIQRNRDWQECEYETEKYGHVDTWGDTGVGAGLEEGLRKNKLMRQCLELKGWVAE